MVKPGAVSMLYTLFNKVRNRQHDSLFASLKLPMKRLLTFFAIVVAVVVSFGTMPLIAAPSAQEGVVSSPRPNAVLRGVVSIEGTATHPEFQKYEVRVAAGLNPNIPDENWIRVNISEQPVAGGQLAVWDTTSVPDGAYILRLRVVRRDSNYQDVDIAPLNVANAAPPTSTLPPTPAETPTPEVTLTPLEPGATFTPGTPIATLAPGVSPTTGGVATLPPSNDPTQAPIVIDQPTIIIPTSTTDPNAVAVVPVPTRTGSGGGSDNGLGLPFPTELPNLELGEFSDAVVLGASVTVGVFLVIGLLYMIRALFRAVRR